MQTSLNTKKTIDSFEIMEWREEKSSFKCNLKSVHLSAAQMWKYLKKGDEFGGIQSTDNKWEGVFKI